MVVMIQNGVASGRNTSALSFAGTRIHPCRHAHVRSTSALPKAAPKGQTPKSFVMLDQSSNPISLHQLRGVSIFKSFVFLDTPRWGYPPSNAPLGPGARRLACKSFVSATMPLTPLCSRSWRVIFANSFVLAILGKCLHKLFCGSLPTCSMHEPGKCLQSLPCLPA